MKNTEATAAIETNPTAEVGAARPVDRREFLEWAALSSVALLLASKMAHGGEGGGGDGGSDSGRGVAAPGRHAAFHSLAPGDVRPEGWLKLYLQKQADQLGSHLPQVSWPFTGAYWSGEETPPDESGIGWWPWEQKAYWVDGALRCALALGDENLLRAALAPVDYTLNHVGADGYIGPVFARDAEANNPTYGNFRWFHTVFFRALAAHGEATQDPRVAAAMRRHYLADHGRARYGGPSRDVTNVEGMLWAYQRTGDRQLLAMAEKAWNDFTRSAAPGDRSAGDLHPDRVFANTPIHAHGVTYAEQSKLPAILYLHTGNPEYLRFALAAQERIFSHHMLIDGIPSSTEAYRGTTPLDAHETCDISDHMWSWGYLLMATGDGQWADHIERACFNAGMGAIKKDWKALQYFSCPNQVIATQDSSHVPFVEPSKSWMAFSPNPGHTSSCCGGNVHRFFPNYVIRMWMADSKGGLAAMLYGTSRVHAEVGALRQRIEIHQETNYPFDEEIHFVVHATSPVTFPLSLRIPGWCKTPTLTLNGRLIALPPVHKGLVRLERTFQPGDRLTLTLPMHTVVSYWANDWPTDALGLEHGPLVYALAVKEEWVPVITPQWSTAEFPEWDAKPKTAWNYGIAVEEHQAAPQAQIERHPMSADPWLDPPVTLTVAMKKIPGWDLLADHKHPGRKQTPPLPAVDDDLAELLKKSEVERVALVPYGTTHLRLTIFAKV